MKFEPALAFTHDGHTYFDQGTQILNEHLQPVLTVKHSPCGEYWTARAANLDAVAAYMPTIVHENEPDARMTCILSALADL